MWVSRMGPGAVATCPVAGKSAVRALHKYTGFERGIRALNSPIFGRELTVQGREGLSKLGWRAPKRFTSCPEFNSGVLLLNSRLGRAPQGAAAAALTRDEAIGAALALVQGVHHIKEEHSVTRDFCLSLYHLLRGVVPERTMLDAFQASASHIVVHRGDFSLLGLDDASQWAGMSERERQASLRAYIAKMPLPPEAAQLRQRVQFQFGDLVPAAAMGGLECDRGEQDGFRGDVTLSNKALAGSGEESVMARCLLPALVAHEMVHIVQHAAMDFPARKRMALTDHDMAPGVLYALSMALQDELRELGRPDLVPFLPHEKEAWAMSAFIIRELIRSGVLPASGSASLTKYLVDHAPRIAVLLSGADGDPLAEGEDGHVPEPWHLPPLSEGVRQTRVQAVAQFVHEGSGPRDAVDA